MKGQSISHLKESTQDEKVASLSYSLNGSSLSFLLASTLQVSYSRQVLAPRINFPQQLVIHWVHCQFSKET